MATPSPLHRREAAIIAAERYGPYTVLRCEDAGGQRPEAGQFYMLSAARRWGGGDGERPFLPRAFSVLRARPRRAEALELQFLVEDVGPGTNRLCELEAGDALLLLGPLGRGFAPSRDGRSPLLVGGGVGIAPLAIWQDTLGAAAGRPLLGFRDGVHAEGARLLAEAALATDDGSLGHCGRVTDLLEEALARSDACEVYACGPPLMLDTVRALCRKHRVPAQVALEAGMACGFGACFGCVVSTRSGYVRLCLEGPVLDAEQLDTASAPGDRR